MERLEFQSDEIKHQVPIFFGFCGNHTNQHEFNRRTSEHLNTAMKDRSYLDDVTIGVTTHSIISKCQKAYWAPRIILSCHYAHSENVRMFAQLSFITPNTAISKFCFILFAVDCSKMVAIVWKRFSRKTPNRPKVLTSHQINGFHQTRASAAGKKLCLWHIDVIIANVGIRYQACYTIPWIVP